MSPTIEAVYEQGVFRPRRPVDLAEGTRVEVIVIAPTTDKPNDAPPTGIQTPAEILAEIAAWAEAIDSPTRDGRDHDAILYGREGARSY